MSPRRPQPSSIRQNAHWPTPVSTSSTFGTSSPSKRITARSSSGNPRRISRAAGSILNTIPRYAQPLHEETDGSHPCAPQGKERIDPTVPEGESGMGRDGKGGDRGDNRPLTPGGPVDGLHRRAAQRRLWRAERTPRDGSERDSDPVFQRDQIRAAGGSRQSDQTRHEPSDTSEGSSEGPEQPTRPGVDRVAHPPSVPVLQVARRPALRLGLFLEARGAASEVGGPWSRAWMIWRPRACSIARGGPRLSSTTRPGSASSATTIRTARPPPRSWRGPSCAAASGSTRRWPTRSTGRPPPALGRKRTSSWS